MRPDHIKSFYWQYESMKSHQKEIKDLTDLKISLGYPTDERKGQMEPRTKAREDKATIRARAKRMEEVIEFLQMEKIMTSIRLSHIKTLLKDLKGEGIAKCKQTMHKPTRPIKMEKKKARQEEEEGDEEEGKDMEEMEMHIPTKKKESIPKPKLIIKDPSPI